MAERILNDPEGDQEFFEWLAEEIGVTEQEARELFMQQLEKFDDSGRRIQ